MLDDLPIFITVVVKGKKYNRKTAWHVYGRLDPSIVR